MAGITTTGDTTIVLRYTEVLSTTEEVRRIITTIITITVHIGVNSTRKEET